MIYFTYGRKQVMGEWNHPTGFLPEWSTYAIEYMANYYGSIPSGSLDIIADFDPTEITKQMYDDAVAAQPPSPSGSL